MAIKNKLVQTLLPATVDFVNYSRRKTISLSISSEGKLTARVPYGTSHQILVDVIEKKREWITKNKKRVQDSIAKNNRLCRDGEVLFVGDRYKLKSIKSNENRVQLSAHILLIKHLPETAPSELLHRWYGEQGVRLITPIAADYSAELNLSVGNINITSATTRWGSCNYRLKSLNFSWRIIMAPKPVIKYVVLHELLHLLVPNHSKLYWTKVAGLCPDYRQHKFWLRENNHLMNLDYRFIFNGVL